MENVSDALYIAGAVLMLVIALTVAMSSFSTIRTQIDEIIQSDAQVDLATEEDGSYINYILSSDQSDIRTVGVETIISSMYRVLKENYNLYIKLKDPSGLTTINATRKIVYSAPDGTNSTLINAGDRLIEISLAGSGINSEEDIERLLSGTDGLYAKLIKPDGTPKKFKEYLGVYQEATDTSVSEINKATFRVITYIEDD